ncbi:unnamed protein product [Adineta ricciae]|uniref:Uncharacterized protein n=1 Tax=Adineta ricciae TaxID=249248 RepID=A0A815TIK5_ADIRI|nr:unnamed protein product [Adineta ricciae]
MSKSVSDRTKKAGGKDDSSSESGEKKSSKQTKPAGTTKGAQPTHASAAPHATTKAAQPTHESAAPHATTKAAGTAKPVKTTKKAGGKDDSSSESGEKKSSKQTKPAGTTKGAQPTHASAASHSATKGTHGTKAPATKASSGPKPTKHVDDSSSDSDEKPHGTRKPRPSGVTKGTKAPGATKAPATKGPVANGTVTEASATKGPAGTKAPATKASSGPKPTKHVDDSSSDSDEKPRGSRKPRPSGVTKGTKAPGATKATKALATKGPAGTKAPATKASAGPKPTKHVDDSSSDSDEQPHGSRKPRPSGVTKGTKAPGATKATKAPATKGPATKGPVANGTATRTPGTKRPAGSKAPATKASAGPKPTKRADDSSSDSDEHQHGSRKPRPSGVTKRTKAPGASKATKTPATKGPVGTKAPGTIVHGSTKAAPGTTVVKKTRKPSGGAGKTGCPQRSSESDSSDSSSSSEEGKPKPTRKTQVTKRRTGHVVRILSTSADVPYSKDGRFDSTCAKCALRKISSTLLLEGVTLEQISSRLCGRFPQNFKYVLAAEIRKFQRVGLKSIDITNISTDKKNNLIIDFDIIVDPKYNEAIRSALRRAVVAVDLQRVFKYQQRY